MLSSKIKHLTLGVSAAFAMMYSPAYATSISVGVTPSFADALSDIIGFFQNYYIVNGNYSYDVVFTIDSPANLKSTIISGGSSGPYDLFLSPDDEAPHDLKDKYPHLVVGSPFHYATDFLMLYSTSVDISGGLPSSLTQDFVIPDPATDVYGKAAVQVLTTTPGYRIALRQGHVKIRVDVGTAFAAVDEGFFAYGFVAKSQICQYYGGSEHYVAGTYHHQYNPEYSAHPYDKIKLTGIQIARTRTKDQDVELTNFVNFLTGNGTSVGTGVIKQYCYKVPDQSGEGVRDKLVER